MASKFEKYNELFVGEAFVADDVGLAGATCSSMVRKGLCHVVGKVDKPVLFNDGEYHIRPVNIYIKDANA